MRVHRGGCDGELFAETSDFEERPGTGEALGLDASYDMNGFRIVVEDAPRGGLALDVCAKSILGDVVSSARVNVQMMRGVQLTIESPLDRATVGKDIVVRGWAVDLDAPEGEGPGIDLVFIMPGHNCDGEPYGDSALEIERSDVQERFGLDDSFLASGFEFVLQPDAPAGNFAFSACALSNTTGELLRVTHTTTVSRGFLSHFVVQQGGGTVSSPVEITGWAIDPEAGYGNGPGVDAIHIFAGDTCGAGLLLESEFNVERPDVIDVFALDESYLPSGYSIQLELPPGAHTIAVCGHSTVTDTFADPWVLNLNIQ